MNYLELSVALAKIQTPFANIKKCFLLLDLNSVKSLLLPQ